MDQLENFLLSILPSSKLYNIDPGSHRAWKMSETTKMGDFQGQQVNFPDGNIWDILLS